MDSPLRGSPVCRSLADIAAHHKDRVGGSADMDRETHTFLPGGGGGGMADPLQKTQVDPRPGGGMAGG